MRISDWSSDVCSSDLALELPPLAVGLLTVGALAAGSRALHWDGLSATVDGLAASYDMERSIAVIRSGTSRTDERRVGKESDGKCRSRWRRYHTTQKPQIIKNTNPCSSHAHSQE